MALCSVLESSNSNVWNQRVIYLLEEQPPSMDVRSAIEELQSRNAAFEQRFTGLGDALVEINSALQGLQTAVQDLVFNRQRPVQEEKKADNPRMSEILLKHDRCLNLLSKQFLPFWRRLSTTEASTALGHYDNE